MALPRFIQPSFAAGELAPALHARVDLAKYHSGLKRAQNVFCLPYGGVSNRPGLEFVGEVKDSARATRLIPWQFSSTQAYILELGHQTLRFIRDGGYILEAAKTITAVTHANPTVVTSAAHGFSDGDEVYVTAVGGATGLNARNFRVTNKTTDTFELVDLYGVAVSTLAMGAYTSGGTVARIYSIATPWPEGDVFKLNYAQSADVMYITHGESGYAEQKLSRIGETNWTISAVTYGTTQAAPTSAAVTYSGGSASVTGNYRVTAINDATAQESLVSNTASATIPVEASWPAGAYAEVTWSAAAGASRYNVYKDNNGIYGYIGGTEGLSFRDYNIVADLGNTPQTQQNPFTSNNHPRTVAFFEQRQILGGTATVPYGLNGSQTGLLENFNYSVPTKATDAFAFSLIASPRRQVNEIRHLLPLGDLLVFTSDAVWKIAGGGNSTVISPTAPPEMKPQFYLGISTVAPIVVNDTGLFVTARGNFVREVQFSFEKDRYSGNDLSILSRHLFEGYTIVDWTYAQSPNSVVWATRSDGVLLALTYQREHEVYAWTRGVITDGAVESVASIVEGEEDAVYCVVARTINGQAKRYVERLHTRQFTDVADCFFVDSGRTYSGAPATTITGLHHLEGETVAALSDGNVIRDLTVTGGAVTLSRASGKVHIGLGYEALIETLPIEAQTQSGTLQGRKLNIGRLTLKLQDSRGLFCGTSEATLFEWKQRAGEPLGEPIALFTGDAEFSPSGNWSGGQVVIKQRDPLPMTLLATIPGVVVGD